jgi:hypothetical protein
MLVLGIFADMNVHHLDSYCTENCKQLYVSPTDPITYSRYDFSSMPSRSLAWSGRAGSAVGFWPRGMLEAAISEVCTEDYS